MAAQRRSSTSFDSKTNEALLKSRVKELEEEVGKLKRRLDDLRKAKNQTFLKREREVLEVGTPFGKRNSKSELRGSEIQTASNGPERSKELADLKKKHDEEMEELKQKMSSPSCNHEPEILSLQKRIDELLADNAALLIENDDLKDRVNSLVFDLSTKEAKWCEREEELKIQLQKSWGEKYKEWMEKTEGKLAELQQANMLLRGYLKNQKPTGLDPSKQDRTDPDLT